MTHRLKKAFIVTAPVLLWVQYNSIHARPVSREIPLTDVSSRLAVLFLESVMKKGWIKLHRRVRDHWVWQDKPFSKGQAFADLILRVNHNNNKFLHGAELIELNRGELITSEVQLSRDWGWSRTKTRQFLNQLVRDKMIDKKSDNKKTWLKVRQFRLYNDSETAKEHQKNIKKTSKKHQKNTNKNIEECFNNDEEIKSLSEGARFTLNEKKIIFQNITGILIDDTELESFKKAVDAVELSGVMIDEIAVNVKQYFDVCMQRGWTKFVYGKKWESIRKYFAVFLSQDSLNFQYSQISAGNPPKKKAKGA